MHSVLTEIVAPKCDDLLMDLDANKPQRRLGGIPWRVALCRPVTEKALSMLPRRRGIQSETTNAPREACLTSLFANRVDSNHLT